MDAIRNRDMLCDACGNAMQWYKSMLIASKPFIVMHYYNCPECRKLQSKLTGSCDPNAPIEPDGELDLTSD